MSFDPDALTNFQRVLLESYPANNEAFRRFAGPIDRAEAVAAGAVEDPLLDDLLGKLGPDCASIDEASAAVTAAADATAQRAEALRGTPGQEWSDQALLMGSLRTAAARLWSVSEPSRGRISP